MVVQYWEVVAICCSDDFVSLTLLFVTLRDMMIHLAVLLCGKT